MRAILIAAGWGIAAAIVWLSLSPSPPQVDIEQGDKLGHFAGYGTLMFWFCLLYTRTQTRLAYGVLWIAMGIGLEFLQGQLGYRSYEVQDMAANTIGVLIGWTAALIFPAALPAEGTGKR
ncbi:MAG: VanZ family protein [Betaproteobacteria bacterium]